MAVINELGQSISYESSNLIKNLKREISDQGEDLVVAVKMELKEGAVLYTDYDTCGGKKGYTETMSATELLKLLEKQNEIF